MPVKEVKTKDEFDSILKDNDKVIVDFSATWCGPCRMIGPKFATMADEYKTIVAIKIDVDEVSDVAEEAGVSAMPTFQVYVGGTKADELVGASEAKLKEMFDKYA